MVELLQNPYIFICSAAAVYIVHKYIQQYHFGCKILQTNFHCRTIKYVCYVTYYLHTLNSRE